jgi:hypothetical protein
MHRAGVIRGSRPLRHYLAGWRAEAKYRGVACHMPKRLPSRPLGENTPCQRAYHFEDSLPDVASRSLRRRGEVGRTTTSASTTEKPPNEHKASHPGIRPIYRARGRINPPWRCCSIACPIQPATRPRAKIVNGELAGRPYARANAASTKSIVAGLRST